MHGPTAGDRSVLGETGRNSSSALLRVLLLDGDGGEAGLLLVGDADYSVLERMFADAAGRLDQLAWDTTVAAHHCSQHAVFGPNAEGNEERKQLVLDGLEATARPGARIVASSRPFRSRDATGDDPPHRVRAKPMTSTAARRSISAAPGRRRTRTAPTCSFAP